MHSYIFKSVFVHIQNIYFNVYKYRFENLSLYIQRLKILRFLLQEYLSCLPVVYFAKSRQFLTSQKFLRFKIQNLLFRKQLVQIELVSLY